jgi:hypothetical protein
MYDPAGTGGFNSCNSGKEEIPARHFLEVTGNIAGKVV